jgi:hypothetical protein
MRNEFYPKRLAEYMTKAQLRELGLDNVELERDSTFGMFKQQPASVTPEKEERVEVEVELLRVGTSPCKLRNPKVVHNTDLYSLNVPWLS